MSDINSEFWQQRRENKLGVSIPKAKVEKERKWTLKQWYEMQATQSPGKCENCSKSLEATINFHPRAHIAHILPKAHFKSVETHPVNRIFLCLDCHDLYDKNFSEELPVARIAKFRAKSFIKLVAKEEKRRIPKYFLK